VKIGEWGDTVKRELIGLMLGQELGAGISRTVYECSLDPKFVVKVEPGGGQFQNVAEWEIWNALSGTEAAKWLAPCRTISSCGSVLIQARTQPLRRHELPKHMPLWLTDFKQQNYGRLNGRLVCHDYAASARIMINNAAWKRTQRAEWWSVDEHG
jgi:hypothetical protein